MILPPVGKGRFYDLVHKFCVSLCLGGGLVSFVAVGFQFFGKRDRLTKDEPQPEGGNSKDNFDFNKSKETL